MVGNGLKIIKFNKYIKFSAQGCPPCGIIKQSNKKDGVKNYKYVKSTIWNKNNARKIK